MRPPCSPGATPLPRHDHRARVPPSTSVCAMRAILPPSLVCPARTPAAARTARDRSRERDRAHGQTRPQPPPDRLRQGGRSQRRPAHSIDTRDSRCSSAAPRSVLDRTMPSPWQCRPAVGVTGPATSAGQTLETLLRLPAARTTAPGAITHQRVTVQVVRRRGRSGGWPWPQPTSAVGSGLQLKKLPPERRWTPRTTESRTAPPANGSFFIAGPVVPLVQRARSARSSRTDRTG